MNNVTTNNKHGIKYISHVYGASINLNISAENGH